MADISQSSTGIVVGVERGHKILVWWGKFGPCWCKVDHIGRDGAVWAVRWNKKRSEWTTPRKVEWVNDKRWRLA